MPKPLQSFGVKQILREDGIQEERPGVYIEFGAEDYDEDLEWRDEIDIELGNKELPIFNYKREIVDTIHNN